MMEAAGTSVTLHFPNHMTGPLSVTKTASSVKMAATAVASLLLIASSNALMFASSFWVVCGSTASFCCAKAGNARLIANTTRANKKGFFIVYSIKGFVGGGKSQSVGQTNFIMQFVMHFTMIYYNSI